jgi:hypothetical protein
MRKFLAVIVLIFLSSFPAKPVVADELALKVAPLFFDLNIDPGGEKSGQIYLENKSDSDQNINVEFSDFFIDDQGNYIFSEGKDVQNPELKPYLMKDWLSVDNQKFSLKQGENRLVQYAVRVPTDANLGGHYGVIFFHTDCQKVPDKNVIYSDQSSLCVSGRVGAIFLLSVGGNSVKKGEIKKIDVPRVTLSDKADFSVDILNTGNTHFRPEGNISAKGIFGNEVYRMDVKDKTLLPFRDYAFKGEVPRGDILGVYKISGNIVDGDGNEMKISRWIFMVPWREILVFGVVLGGIWGLRRRFEVKKIR